MPLFTLQEILGGYNADGIITVSGRARIKVWGKAYDHAHVEAFGGALVMAHDAVYVRAYDKVRVIAWGGALISAYGNTQIRAYDHALIWAHDEGRVNYARFTGRGTS